ncbi:MAG: 30S ribosomal protein S4 [bacterium]
MARYTESLCRLCRREGIQLFLKGTRCMTEKCAYSRRPYIPGQHHNTGKGNKKMSEYGKQLREKQKAKRIYGVLERQFEKYFEIADRKKGETGENLIRILEERLDNAVYRSGFATSRVTARQLVNHGHVMINGKKVNIPSYQVRPGEKITIKEKTLVSAAVNNAMEDAKKKKNVPTWIEMNFDKKEAVIKSEPVKTDVNLPVQVQLIVELYSK